MLSNAQKLAINTAVINSSNIKLKNALQKLNDESFITSNLINVNNKYLNKTLAVIEKHLNIGGTKHKFKIKDVSKYLAASTIAHCFDGWNFLARSVDAQFNGDVSSCIHFAYYSELRSVMAIMATKGIGIFNSHHIYFDARGNIQNFAGPTHQVAEHLLKCWANQNQDIKDVFKIIRVDKYSLFQLIESSGLTVTHGYMHAILRDWIKEWSLDLELIKDQHIRNETSYRPHFNLGKFDYLLSLNKIKQLWTPLEPLSSSPYDLLDRHLARIAIEKMYKLSTGGRVGTIKYARIINQLLSNLGENDNLRLKDFLLVHPHTFSLDILEEAKSDSKKRILNLNDPTPILARAILLARISTGLTNNFIGDSSIAPSSLEFWRDAWGQNLGLLNAPRGVQKSSDLYSEITDAIAELDIAILADSNVYGIINNNPNFVNPLKQFQKACFWGLGL
jgi:hypothetical protein